MKKIIVTGGQGFIGSNLIELLLKKKYFVINIDKSSYSANPYNVRNFKSNKNYIFFKQDINNRRKIYHILKKFKLINKKVAIECNGVVIPRIKYKKKYLKNNDKLEVVHFIGGG